MRYSAFAIFIVLLDHATAQTLAEKPYIMRSDTATVDQYSGATRICIAVFPDGQYRMERTFQSNQGGAAAETRVFLDKLPPDDLKSLETALDGEDLQKIRTPKPHRGDVILDWLALTVPREHFVQILQFETAAEQKPYEKSLEPLYAAMKAIQKRKIPASKTETPNGCAVPRPGAPDKP